MKYLKKGFTLIELIIVMAILGILAVGLIAVLDPAQQILRANDTGTKNSVNEVVRAAQRYANQNATSGGLVWPANVTAILNSGEIKSAPAGVTFGQGLSSNYYACFQPTSKAMKSDLNTKWTDGIGTNNTCVVAYNSSCYYCIQAN